jgi:hypothetical protein
MMRRRTPWLCLLAMASGLLGLAHQANAGASWRVNGIGWGSCSADVTAAAGGAVSAVGFTGFNSECCVPAGVYVPCTNWAPLPAGANAGSFAGSWFRGPWRGALRGASAGGDGWSVNTAAATGGTVGVGCGTAGGDADVSLTVSGSTYTLSGTWESANPLTNATVCVECGGAVVQCVQRSGVWSESLNLSGTLCQAQPGPGQTEADWYANNVYLSVDMQTPVDASCVPQTVGKVGNSNTTPVIP